MDKSYFFKGKNNSFFKNLRNILKFTCLKLKKG